MGTWRTNSCFESKEVLRCYSGKWKQADTEEAVWFWPWSGGWSTTSLSVWRGPIWTCLSQKQDISFFIEWTHLSVFCPLLTFSQPPTHPSSFNTAHPSSPSLPEALSSELPRFFIKELSLKPSNYYGEREIRERREGRHLGGCICFSDILRG